MIPHIVTDLTGISNIMVKEARSFNEVATEFFTFIEDKREMLEDGSGEEMNTKILVAHNGKQFDLLFLMEELKRNNVLYLIGSDRYGYAIDTMILAKNVTREKNLPLHALYKLSALFEHVLGQQMDQSAHRALVDVKAMSAILRYDPVWQGHHKHVFFFCATESVTNDGDSDSEADIDSNVEEDEITEDVGLPNSVLGWEKCMDFDGDNAMQKFNEVATEFFTFIEDKRQMLEDGLGEEMNMIILVIHNGKRFDLLFLMEEMKRNNVLYLIDSNWYGYAIDTMILAKNVTREKNLPLPVSYKLSALFEHVLGQQMDPNAHRALIDVKATSTILFIRNNGDLVR